MSSVVSTHFGQAQAPSYDEKAAKFASIRDALNFVIRLVLADIPIDARILCVGVGTGAELLDLARAFPSWHFTAVEPSNAMLEICRKKIEEAGFASRCDFHEGYLDSLSKTQPFHAVTSILVSHFLTDHSQRRDFFRQMRMRLVPSGYLINADLASVLQDSDLESLFDVWMRAHGMAQQGLKPSHVWGKDVSVLNPSEIESILEEAGFERPVLFYQAMFIHAWYARNSV